MRLQALLEETKPKLPPKLYHASAFKATILEPGYKHVHKLVKWDNGETNHYLYATTDRQAAIDMGVASAIEHKYELDSFSVHGDSVTIKTPADITLNDISRLRVYIYMIHPDADDQWLYNHNGSNHMRTEYKTKSDVEPYAISTVDVGNWLKGKKVTLNGE